ncbi:MAG: hypothetical protein IRZ16_21615 [Myxococcaceae bacterium]|nr:hypothetical protein [Myxococcaceae bacterium]
MRALGVILWAGAVASAAAVAGCGPIESFPPDDPPSGAICYTDADCVPNGCCGEGTAAVHRDEAPDCSAVMCDGSCDPNMINCGCAVPICRDSHCATAVSDSCL